MTTFDVLERFGTAALAKHVGTLLLFLLLQLARIPLLLLDMVLCGVMSRLDSYATEQASRPPTRPINHFGRPRRGHGQEVS